jgi:hypothetical protein
MIFTILSMLFQGIFLGFFSNPMLGAMKNQAGEAGTVAGQFGSQAGTEGAQLNPFLSQEMKATHGLTPGQQNEMLTASEAGAGGALGGLGAGIQNNAARLGNSTGVGKTLDEMARDRAKAAAGASEGIAAQDVMGAKQMNQQGAAGMQGLYGTNTSGQLNAMKQQGSDLSAAANMTSSPFADLAGVVGMGAQIGKTVASMQQPNNQNPNS